jgi:hypothetical protein
MTMSNFITLNDQKIEIIQAVLETTSTPVLLEIHNELASKSTVKVAPVKSWKRAKQALIDRILTMVEHSPKEEAAAKKEQAKEEKKSKPKGKGKKAGNKKANGKSKPKAKASGKLPKSFLMLQAILDTGDKGITPADLATELETSAGSVNSYRSYFRTGAKGHPQVDITVFAGKLILEDQGRKAAEKAINDKKGA